MNILKKIRLLGCKLGIHRYHRIPVLANLDNYWMQGGLECSICRKRTITFKQASVYANIAYERGKQTAENKFLAYGKGVEKIVELYGKEYVHKLIDK